MITIVTRKFKLAEKLPGGGKSKAAHKHINDNPDMRFIYITPYLDEVSRAITATNGRLKEPEHNGIGKLQSLKKLLANGEDIAATHALFLTVDDEVLALIKQGEYTLIIDECLDILLEYNSLITDRRYFKGVGDIQIMIADKKIGIDTDGYVHWLALGNYDDYNDALVKEFANSGNLVCVKEKLLLWAFPHRVFNAFKDVFVLTHRFDGSMLDCYFRFHGFECERIGVKKISDSEYAFTEYDGEKESHKHLQSLIHIIEDDTLNEIGSGSKYRFRLNVNWYKNAKTEQITQLRRNINTVIKRRFCVPSSKIMWTCFKDYELKLNPEGAVWAEPTTPKQKKTLSKRELSKRKCFVSVNARGTNDFRSRTHLMYLVNRFQNLDIISFFERKGIEFNDDNFALSEMIQWIFRSAIRDGKEIWLYCPSKRMRDLLKNWLCE